MAYQVVKAWPSDCAIDEIITLTVPGSVKPGFGGIIDDSGEGVVGTFVKATTDDLNDGLAFFCIDEDTVTGKVTGLMNKCVIEVDADHYVAGSYVAGNPLTLKAGKFDLFDPTQTVPGTPDDYRPVIAKVLNYNATTGKMRIIWVG